MTVIHVLGKTGSAMIILEVVRLVAGLLLGITLLMTAGRLVMLIGVVLMISGRTGHAVGNRRHYF